MNLYQKTFLLYIIALLITYASSKSAVSWRERSIYQVLTDRIVIGRNPECVHLKQYCGGQFKDLAKLLPFIQDELGFDAIYISPIVENIAGGYHGYWAKDFYKLNSHFAEDENDLKQFIQEAHRRGILVMVDVVFNHVGYVPGNDFSGIVPFNKPQHYHDLCHITDHDYNTNNQLNIEKCRLFNLPDLNTESEEVKGLLFDWIKNDILDKYGFDGIRIDTVKHVNMRFWQELNVILSNSNSFAIGEVMHSQTNYVAEYQTKGNLDSLLDYPSYHQILNAFVRRMPMQILQDQYLTEKRLFRDLDNLGVFLDNHDVKRIFNFLQTQEDSTSIVLNALTYIYMSYGIPIVYYGTESKLSGGDDPANREVYDPYQGSDPQMRQYIKTLNTVRRQHRTFDLEPDWRIVQPNLLVFSKGSDILVVTQNSENVYQVIFVQNHPFMPGDKLCNAFSEWDCVTVDEERRIKVTIVEGYPKIYIKQVDTPQGPNTQQNLRRMFFNIIIAIFMIGLAFILFRFGSLEDLIQLLSSGEANKDKRL